METQQLQLSDDLRFQLQCVFDACDFDNTGSIRLRDLADLSRGHVGSGDVEQVLQILGPGNDDKINFSQFCSRVMNIMNSGAAVDLNTENPKVVDNNHSVLDNSPTHGRLDTSANSPLNRVMDNSPLKLKRSPRRASMELNNSGSPARRFGRKNSKQKLPQGQMVGRIPLVNTSSEEDDELEDSFDRQIAASLETARPNRMIPDPIHRPTRVQSLNNSPVKGGFQRTGIMRSTVRRSGSRLPSGCPAPSKPSSDDKLTEESFTSPLTGCPQGETISPVLPRSDFSTSSSPLSSSPSEISSTVFNEETPESSSFPRKDSSRKSPVHQDSSRQTPVMVQCMAPNRDTPLHISETDSPLVNNVAIINTSNQDNTTVIQVSMEADGKTLVSEKREEQQLKRLSGPIENMVLEIEALSSEKEEANDKTGEMVRENEDDDLEFRKELQKEHSERVSIMEKHKIDMNGTEKDGTFSKVFGEMEGVLNEVIKVVAEDIDKPLEPVEVFDRINELSRQAGKESVMKKLGDLEMSQKIEDVNQGSDVDLKKDATCPKVPTIEIDYAGDEGDLLEDNGDSAFGSLVEDEENSNKKLKAQQIPTAAVKQVEEFSKEEVADDTRLVCSGIQSIDLISVKVVKDDKETLTGQIVGISEEVREVTTQLHALSGDLKNLSGKESLVENPIEKSNELENIDYNEKIKTSQEPKEQISTSGDKGKESSHTETSTKKKVLEKTNEFSTELSDHDEELNYDDDSSQENLDLQFDNLLEDEFELDPVVLANVEKELFVDEYDPVELFGDNEEDPLEPFGDDSSQDNVDIQFDDLLGNGSELDPTEVANVEKELFGDDDETPVELFDDDYEDPVKFDCVNLEKALLKDKKSINPVADDAVKEQSKVLSQDLEEDFSTLISKAPSPEDYDSPSSGVGSSTGGWTSSGTGGWGSGVGSTNGVSTISIRADLEDEMSSSINRVRKLAEEKAKAERIRHQEEMDGLQRERALERKNFQLRLEQFQTEKDQMKNEIMTLREKVKLLHMEKENTEEQLLQLAEQNEQVAVQEQEEQPQQKEEELLIQIDQLSSRVTSQDSDLAEVREDNAVLRSQNKKLKEAMQNINKDKDNRFRIFGAAKEPVPSWTDPCWDDPTDVRKRVRRLEEELADQREVNSQLKAYVGEVLVNIMVKNPQILEKN